MILDPDPHYKSLFLKSNFCIQFITPDYVYALLSLGDTWYLTGVILAILVSEENERSKMGSLNKSCVQCCGAAAISKDSFLVAALALY